MPYQIPTAGIEDSAVNAAKIATDAVGTTEIISDGVRTTDIQNSAVTTAKINDDAVTYAKIQNVATANRVLGSTSAAGAVSEVQVQTAMIANSAVTTAKINDESVTLAKLDPSINFFPSGGIVMWSGTIANIPTGWVLCDGQNSTPDLRDRFIVGARNDTGTGVTFNAVNGALSGTYGVGNTGGEVAHQLTVAEMPSHNHSELYNTASSGQDQAGSGSGDNDNTSGTNTGSTGGNNYHENRPPYYALAFIMKT